jgi:hypothetical protein
LFKKITATGRTIVKTRANSIRVVETVDPSKDSFLNQLDIKKINTPSPMEAKSPTETYAATESLPRFEIFLIPDTYKSYIFREGFVSDFNLTLLQCGAMLVRD